mmetsp:Transcript_25652/g.80958  ORF Transcript_25652/g.80958 Transcript_25652/m.80958 type:complete len:89 (-) Transcript_25652:70-336(-)
MLKEAIAHARFDISGWRNKYRLRLDCDAIACRSGRWGTAHEDTAHAEVANANGPKAEILRLAAAARASRRGGCQNRSSAFAHAVFASD